MSSEALPERAYEPEEEHGTEKAPLPKKLEEEEKSKIIDLPAEIVKRKRKEAEERKAQKEAVEASKPKGDAKEVLKRVIAYDKIRFTRTGESCWHDAEVVGWVDKDHLKLAIIDDGEKTDEVIELHKADIYAADIIEGAYDYMRKMREK